MIKKTLLYMTMVTYMVTISSFVLAQDNKDETIGEDKKQRLEVKIEKSRYTGSKAATDYYMRGKEQLSLTGDANTAVQYFLSALKEDPSHAPSNYELARIASPEIALQYSLIANKSDTTNAWYQNQLADIYIKQRNIKAAIEVKLKSIRQQPKKEDNYRNLAAYYYYSGDVDKAFSTIKQIEDLFGMNPEVAMMHCNMIKTLPPTEANKAIVEGYVNDYPDISDFMIVLADMYARMKNYSVAIICYGKVKDIDPDDLRGDVALFDYYNAMRNEREMFKYMPSVFRMPEVELAPKLDLFKKFIADNISLYRSDLLYVDMVVGSLLNQYPDEPKVRKIYNDHLIKKGNIDLALEYNKSLIVQDKADYDNYRWAIEIEAYNKNVDSLMKYVDIAINRFPEHNHDLKMMKVYGYDMKKDHNSAIILLEKEAKSTDSDSLKSIYFTSVGDIYNQLKKDKNAAKSYEKALKYNPANIVAMNNYSYMLSVVGKKLERALTLSLMVVNKEPSNATYIDTYGYVLYKMKRYKEAREVLSKAVALDTTKSSALLLHYGDVLYRLGLEQLAQDYWKKALEYGEKEEVIKKRFEKGAE